MIGRLLLLGVLTSVICGNAYGLGLGELELRSALNQEFDAEIALTKVRGLEVDEILPGLASQEDFQRVGVERGYMLTDLRFKVVQKSNGELAVRVSSTRPIVEPFLNFIVEVLWPNGRILREYTVLLDPPVFGEEGVQALSPAQSGPRVAAPRPAAPRQAPQPATTPAAAPSERRSRLEEGSMAGGEYGMTGPGDTLWAIAMKVRPDSSITVQQTMLALKRANPDAFINDNINLLKAGYVLRIPDRNEMQRQSASAAVREVRLQNEEFEAYRGGAQVAQLDATGRRQSRAGDTGGQSDEGELRLVASDSSQGQRAGSGADNARAEELSEELAVAKEDLDRARRASAEMNSRLADLEEQIQTANDLVKLKDDQLATLRAQVQRMQAAAEAAPAVVASKPPAQGSLLSNPLVLMALGVLAIGAAVGGLFYMRRKNTSEYEEDEFNAFAVEDDEGSVDETDEEVGMGVVEEDEELDAQTSDPIGEAEIYIAYGRFPQAISFLQNAIEEEPERADIQLKLLEVYVQTEDATAFNLQFEQLRALGDEEAIAKASALQQKIPGAAEAAGVAMDATIVSNEPVTAIEDPGDDDDELSFDLDDLDAETEEDTLDLSDEVDLDDGEDLDINLDDDMDLDLAADSSEDEAEVSLDDDDDSALDLDFGDDDDASGLNLEDDDDDDGVITLDEADLEDDIDLSELEEAGASAEDDELSLDDDDGIELNLDDDDEIDLDFGDDDDSGELKLDDDDDGIELNLDDDDDDGIELNLDEDASTKLDLARAYIDMGDNDGAKNVLEEVIKEGSATEVQEANELLGKI
ncbi:MAG: FimV/HubP family polar landmark protein [Pseudomonadales bacterium]